MLPPVRILLLKFLPCLCLVFLAPTCNAQTSDQKLPQAITDMLNAQVWWDSAPQSKSNPNGLHFQFSKIDETNLTQGHYTRYRVYVPGAPEDQKYSLGAWKIGTKVTDMQIVVPEVYVNAKGLLMLHKPRPDQENKDSVESDDEIDLALQTARGEPVRLVLSNPKKTFLFTGTIVPYPIVSKDGNCRLEARLAEPTGTGILLYADGFPPNSDITFNSISENESMTNTFHIDAHGHGVTIDLPSVVGKDSGVLRESIATKECSVSVEILWGKGSYKPL